MSGILAAMISGAAGVINGALPNGSQVGGTVTWQLNNDGTYTIAGNSDADWVTPSESAVAALYEVKVDVTAGAFASGTTGTWLPLDTTRTWTTDEVTSTTCTFTVTIRERDTQVVRSTQAGVTLNTL